MTGKLSHDLIDLARYPLDRLDAPGGRALVAAGRAQLAKSGACVLPRFVVPEAVAAIRAEVEALLPASYYCENRHNAYLAAADPGLSPDHPRNRLEVSDLGCLADDQVSADSLLRAIYEWDELRAFLATLLGEAALYPYEDPLGSLNINVAHEGQRLGWHFDNADFATTILLQPAESGGVFEYIPNVRTPDDEGYETVARVLAGVRDGVCSIDMPPGTLALFQGRYSLHRVTPVGGARPRIIAVLSYDPEPGVRLTEYNRRLFYGRVA